ncbi:MAG: N-acetylglucosamine-6-phosphate deacetylase [Clostridia bacterium]|nr:N-acetylglucosamine-6-phosphate deacetylase [Clostridia bacterium]
MLIKNANVFLPDGRFSIRDLRFEDTIRELGHFPNEEGLDAAGLYLVPGFIDLHTHGAMGCDFSDGDAEGLPRMARHYARHGVTSFLATTMTLPLNTLCAAARTIADFAPDACMSSCAGMFMEGPFLSHAKRGAQAAKHLHAPDAEFFDRVDEASGRRVRMLTVAPEEPGALALIRHAAERCVVAVGHTVAGYDEAAAGFRAGASQLTHLYNGMNALLHRAPGPIGAGMDAGAYAELICDGLHVHPAAVRAAFRLFPERVVLISDSLRCAGMPEGDYSLGGQPITLRQGRCTLRGSDTLAGSVITVHDAVRNAVRFGVDLETAVAAGTHNPARALRLENACGFLRPGLPADLVLLDASLSIRAVYLRGRELRAD